MKACAHCKQLLPLEAFGRKSSMRDGLQPWCRVCRNTAARMEPRPAVRRPGRYCVDCDVRIHALATDGELVPTESACQNHTDGAHCQDHCVLEPQHRF